jgi:hypothetical protein
MQIRFREPWGEADSARPRTVKAGKERETATQSPLEVEEHFPAATLLPPREASTDADVVAAVAIRR